MSHLIQLLLPLQGNDQKPFPDGHFRRVQQELKDRFGGVTAYTRSPAEGQWSSDGAVCEDDIVVYEVMVPIVETEWWASYRKELEQRFAQDELVIRALPMQQL